MFPHPLISRTSSPVSFPLAYYAILHWSSTLLRMPIWLLPLDSCTCFSLGLEERLFPQNFHSQFHLIIPVSAPMSSPEMSSLTILFKVPLLPSRSFVLCFTVIVTIKIIYFHVYCLTPAPIGKQDPREGILYLFLSLLYSGLLGI